MSEHQEQEIAEVVSRRFKLLFAEQTMRLIELEERLSRLQPPSEHDEGTVQGD